MITSFFKKKVLSGSLKDKSSINSLRDKLKVKKNFGPMLTMERKRSASSEKKTKRAKRTKGNGGGVVVMDHERHVLERGEMYVGNTKEVTRVEYQGEFVDGKVRLAPVETTLVPAAMKCIDEIITNACDHFRRTHGGDFPIKNIRVSISLDNNGCIEITNDGNGIAVQKQTLENGTEEWVPALCVGKLLTSENYDDTEKRLVGGRNGFGAALCNIWSKEFKLETAWIDEEGQGHLFKQQWKNNMSVRSTAKVKTVSRKSGYTKVKFVLDFERLFKQDFATVKAKYLPSLQGLIVRRCCDIAACIPEVNVYSQGTRINLKSCVSVSKAFPPLYAYAAMLGAVENTLTYLDLGERWKCVVFAKDPNSPPTPSFVNAVRCDEGGPFVDCVANPLNLKVRKTIQSKTNVKLSKSEVQARLGVCIVSLIENPAFRTQTKDYCTSLASEWGSEPTLTEKDINKAVKKLFDTFHEFALSKKHANAKRQTTVSGSNLVIPKYEGAKLAGTKRRSNQTTLLIVEGDSAAAFAKSGIGINTMVGNLKVGRENFGIFPLRGKLINVLKCGTKKALENNEIKSLCKIIGLQLGVKAERKNLRYGRICILTDQDVDGSHIKGLLLNFLHWKWPETFSFPGFVTVFHTPLLVAKWGRGNKKNFFTKADYNAWKQENQDIRETVKYYKGLATSSSKEAKEYFKSLADHLVAFDHSTPPEEIEQKINTAFSDDTVFKRQRREICLKPFADDIDQTGGGTVSTVPDFVDRELKQFWDENNLRVIPHVCDGLKESQRKIIFTLRHMNIRSTKNEKRVSEVAAFTITHTHYEHGEASLCGTIICMAQNYVGSNNINLLYPSGQFGTRCATKDAGSPRYIHSFLDQISDLVFPPANDVVLQPRVENGHSIEPIHYVGVVPWLLINGARGIGIGVVTNVWQRNPLDVIRITRKRMVLGEAAVRANWFDVDNPMECAPWYKGFKGTIEYTGDRYKVCGLVQRSGGNKVTVTELYPGKYTDKYLDFLSKNQYQFDVLGTEKDVHIEIKDDRLVGKSEGELVQMLKLSTELKDTDIWALADSGSGTTPIHMDVPTIFEHHYQLAIDTYEKRRLHEIAAMEDTLQKHREKIHFIQGWINGAIKPRGTRADLLRWMESGNFTSSDEFKRLRMLPSEQIQDEQKIEELRKQIEDVDTKLEAHRNMTAVEIWGKDLSEFEEYYKTTLVQETEY